MNVAAVAEQKAIEARKLDLKGLLDSRGITRVLFIDDAFDDLTDVEPSSGEQEEVWILIAADDDLLASASDLGIHSQDDLSSDII